MSFQRPISFFISDIQEASQLKSKTLSKEENQESPVPFWKTIFGITIACMIENLHSQLGIMFVNQCFTQIITSLTAFKNQHTSQQAVVPLNTIEKIGNP